MNRSMTRDWFNAAGESPVNELVNDDYTYSNPEDGGYYIYFMIEGANGGIKIGRAKDVFKRLHNLQTGNSRRLRMLAFVKETKVISETRLHVIFDKYHIHGEWFLPAPELFDFITRLRWAEKGEIADRQLTDHARYLYNLAINDGVSIKP